MMRGPLRLPAPLHSRVEAAFADYIAPGPGMAMDFASPAGEHALAAPDSVMWKVFKNPLSLFIGGVAAVLLELAEPRVRAGVWEHTGFRRDPLGRLRRTGLAAMMTVYGPASRARAMIGRVGAMHARVTGTTPEGEAYRADDPELLAWVQATASYGFLAAYCNYVESLGEGERDRYYAEGVAAAALYGAADAPASEQALLQLFAGMQSRLQPSPVILEFLGIMRETRLLPRPLSPLQGLLLRAAIDIVPQPVRRRIGIDDLPRLDVLQRRMVIVAARAADRTVLATSPAVQACRRLGLPEDYLYRR